MKNIIFIFVLLCTIASLAEATKYESSNTDATPVVAYGYYNNTLVAINVDVNGVLQVH